MISVRLNGISKRFAVTAISRRAKLKSRILYKWFGVRSGASGIVYRDAVKDVSFEVRQGESLALLGRNGAGKSTILKMISGQLSPDAGEIQVHGKVGGLIELGAGFTAAKTGRENVVDRATMLGVAAADVGLFVNEAAEFAELGEQFYDPVATYSSGMKARLGFAIAVMLPFDIMVCDEALSVGDARFATKCLAKVNELKQDRIFLFVSHSMAMVQRFCDKAIVLDKGEVVFQGNATDGVSFYENQILHLSDSQLKAVKDLEQPSQSRAVEHSRRGFLEPLVMNKNKVRDWHAELRVEGRSVVIDWQVLLLGSNNGTHAFRLGFPVFSSDGTMLFSCTNEDVFAGQTGAEEVRGKLTVPDHCLHPGVYYLVMAFFEGMEPILRQLLGEIKVASDGVPHFGIYQVKHQWHVQVGAAETPMVP